MLALAGGLLIWRPGRPELRRQAGLDVLLITVDTLRADALGAYGSTSGATPLMDRLSAAGVRFQDAHAHNVLTLPSHANLLSGLYPFRHGVRDNSGFRFPARLDTLATLLKARGYRTGAFLSAFPLDSRFGLQRGFDVYDDDVGEGRASRAAFLEPERAGSATVARAERWIARGTGPVFAWVHVYEPHFPYAPTYEGDVAAADACLGPLLEPLLARGRAGRTLVALTSDHGESLGEHGEATHGLFAYEATLRVPLVLYQPALFDPRVVKTPARHVDLLPTLLDALDAPIPAGLSGKSLLGEIDGTADPAPSTSYFEALAGALQRGWAPLTGVIEGGHKYIDLPLPELYDLRTDSREIDNRVASGGARLVRLRTTLAQFLGPARQALAAERSESAEVRERLASLGYLAGPAPPVRERYDEADDPKRQIGWEDRLQKIVDLTLEGRRAEALLAGRELVREQPEMAVALMHLAQLERDSGDLPAGITALRRALALRPNDAYLASRLAAYLTEGGRAREAIALLEPLARQPSPDTDVLTTLALALARASRTDEALQVLARAREQDPTSAQLLVHAGTVHLMAGQREQARTAFESALAQSPELARAWSSLAVLSLEQDRHAEGLEQWRRALLLDPGELRTLLALGARLWQSGRKEAGRACLELFVKSAPPEHYRNELERVRAWLRERA